MICDGHDSHITASWIAHCMKNNVILMVLPPHSSHLTQPLDVGVFSLLMVLPPHSSHLIQPLDVGVFSPLKTLMASAIEPLISTELHRILKAEWLSAYVEAHDNAFTVQNIRPGFCGTGILPYNPRKVIDCVRPLALIVQNYVEVRGSTPIEVTTPFKDSVLTSFPLNTDETRSANAALLSELNAGSALSTPARNYAKKVVKQARFGRD